MGRSAEGLRGGLPWWASHTHAIELLQPGSSNNTSDIHTHTRQKPTLIPIPFLVRHRYGGPLSLSLRIGIDFYGYGFYGRFPLTRFSGRWQSKGSPGFYTNSDCTIASLVHLDVMIMKSRYPLTNNCQKLCYYVTCLRFIIQM
jgi:hypothetical protein